MPVLDQEVDAAYEPAEFARNARSVSWIYHDYIKS